MSRWIVVPIVGDGTMGNERRPKYEDTEGITATGGQEYNTQKYGPVFVAKFYGSDTALQTVVDQSDTYTVGVDVTQEEAAGYLNKKTNRTKTFSEWEQAFLIGGV